MEISIWIIGEDRRIMIENQRKINDSGSMRAICILSDKAFLNLIEKLKNENDRETLLVGDPSLVVIDYDMASKNNFEMIRILRENDNLAGVPIFFAVEEKYEELSESCYERGAMVVVHKSFFKSEVIRIENTAWQHENTKLYEKKLHKQAMELQNAKEIFLLNQKLESRNQLLYQAFGRYFSDDVVQLILQQGANVSLGGEKKNVTIMMTDLRSFTLLSEKMDSDRVTTILNYYFDRMVDILSKYRGTVIEFLGDGMLAIFGAPLEVENQIDNAVAAAICMQNAMASLNRFFIKNGYPILEMGIGLHYGEAFIGNIGAKKMMRYNVIGSSVNACSRIESCSVGGQILVSKDIINNVISPIIVKNGVEINAKGILEPMWIYEVVGIKGEYNCELDRIIDDGAKLFPVEKHIELHIHPINGKLVDTDYLVAHLVGISNKRMSVSIDDSKGKNIEIYSSVKVSVDYEISDNNSEFYSKVIGRKGDVLTLYFTDPGSFVSEFVRWVFDS